MYIFIDESGLFANPQNNENYVCCLTALIFPEVKKEKIYRDFFSITSKWDFEREEIKGSKLSENEIADIISMLSKHRVLVCVTAIDIGMHNEEQLTKWKINQADKFVANLTPKHHPNVVKRLSELRERFINLPNQLFIQAILLIELVANIIQITTLYYCQRMAHTLKRFIWTIDAKDDALTEYEDIWLNIVSTILQTKSFNEPLNMLKGGNYSYFERFRYSKSELPDYLKEYILDTDELFDATVISKLMEENLFFKNSKSDVGLQIVDILANTIRRAFNNNLGIEGWGNFGKLMIYDKTNTIKMIYLDPDSEEKRIRAKAPYVHVIKEIDKHARPIIKSIKNEK